MSNLELDQAVAERIFGYQWVDHGCWALNYGELYRDEQHRERNFLCSPEQAVEFKEKGRVKYYGIPAYSMDLSFAYEILEKLKVTHWVFLQTYADGGWEAGFAKKTEHGHENWIHGCDIDLAKAICLAAIKT